LSRAGSRRIGATKFMDSRERTFRALEHRPADRLPVDFWASAGTIRKLESHSRLSFEDFLDRHDVDLRYLPGPRYVGPPLATDADIWGVPRTTVTLALSDGTETYQEVKAPPLAGAETPAEVERYPHWPSPDWFDYGGMEAQCDAVRRRRRVVVFMGDRLNRIAQLKPAMYLRGVDGILMDLALREELAGALIGRIRRFYLAYLERILEAARGKIDIVLTGDDFGSQHGLLMSPEMWRRFLGPGFAEYLAVIKAHGARCMHHTCGSVVEIIPDMIAAGLDVLQSLQPEARGMVLAELKARWGGRLAFHGGVSIQRTVPFGTPAAIRAEVERIAALFKPGGGYIFCTAHNIQADAPLRNIEALLAAYRDFA
jgi:uroporphyrinogen decarboxylase